jgi:hypothetical protein
VLFVSYSRDDRQLSGSVLADLDALGHDGWLDEDVTGGQVWWDEILATIRRSDAFLFLLTPSSVESEACLREVEYAQSLKRPIIPVEVAATDPLLIPPVLGRHQIVRYLTGDKADTIALTRALVHADMGRPLPDPLPPEPELPGTYYSELREQITARQQLGIDQQLGLLQRLKARAEAGEASEVIPLLATLRAREDVYAVVASDIDRLATALTPPGSDAAPARPPRIRPPRTRLERTAAAAAAASLLLALGGLLSNKLYTESGTERSWGDMPRDVPRLGWTLLVVVFGVALAVAIGAAGTVARRVGAVVAVMMAALLLASWWGQISELLKLGATELGPALQLLSWSVLLACLAATLGVVAAFTSNVSDSGAIAATASRSDKR